MSKAQEESMNDITVYEARMLATEGMCVIAGNGQLFAICEDSKEVREKFEKMRCENGY